VSLLAFCCLAVVSPPRLMLPCILFRLWRGCGGANEGGVLGMAAQARAHALLSCYMRGC
jgi:hypothetical protein